MTNMISQNQFESASTKIIDFHEEMNRSGSGNDHFLNLESIEILSHENSFTNKSGVKIMLS